MAREQVTHRGDRWRNIVTSEAKRMQGIVQGARRGGGDCEGLLGGGSGIVCREGRGTGCGGWGVHRCGVGKPATVHVDVNNVYMFAGFK